MAAQQIKLDLINLEKTLTQLRNSIDELTSYTTTFRTSTSDRLSEFNSDFISKMDALLHSMKDDVDQELINQMEMTYQEGKAIFDTMQQVDEKAAQAIGGEQS
jgi:hypothetical protein